MSRAVYLLPSSTTSCIRTGYTGRWISIYKYVSCFIFANIIVLSCFAQSSNKVQYLTSSNTFSTKHYPANNSNKQLQSLPSFTETVNSTLPVYSISSLLAFKDSTADSLTKKQIQKRVKIVAGGSIVIYGTALAMLYNTWYKDYPQSSFHSYNDWGEWYRMDKVGHMYSAYALSTLSMEAWRWTGIGRKKSIWLGGISGAAYQTVIEVLDGYSAEWGWSWGDFAANIAGSGLMVAQQLAWDQQRIQMKFSFHKKNYSDPSLNERSDELFGSSTAERSLKDYNGQTYWFSTSLKDIFPKSRIPAWLQFSVGTGAEGMFGGYENVGYDEAGNETFNRTDIPRYRQWYLAPDIDLTKIKTKKKGIRIALYILNFIKFPAPALEYSRGKFSMDWIGF